MDRTRNPDFGLLWLEITRKCQLNCGHCYADSGPEGTHGEMARADWLRVIDQAAALGVGNVSEQSLAEILAGPRLATTRGELRHAFRQRANAQPRQPSACWPDGNDCVPEAECGPTDDVGGGNGDGQLAIVPARAVLAACDPDNCDPSSACGPSNGDQCFPNAKNP
jgi:hypothetical protein